MNTAVVKERMKKQMLKCVTLDTRMCGKQSKDPRAPFINTYRDLHIEKKHSFSMRVDVLT